MLWSDGQQHGAHRIAFELAFGWTLKSGVVCHKCDNPACCNPPREASGQTTPSD